MPDSEHKSGGTPTDRALTWVFGQPFNNVMLIAIFSGIAWFAHYSVTIAVPAHLKMIQQGYESLDQNHFTERHEMRAMYDKWFDRVADLEKRQHTGTSSQLPAESVNN